MIVIAGFVIGAAIGARTAIRRGGRKLDALQYGAGYGIAFALVGTFVTIFADRLLLG